jgi:hypothetical protein
MSDQTAERETDTYVKPGEIGHNQGKEVVWERWQKKRTFVRALEGTYGEVYKSLFAWLGRDRPVDRMPSQRLLTPWLRPEARPHEFRRVLHPARQGP